MYKITIIDENESHIEEYAETLENIEEVLNKYPSYLSFKAEKIHVKVKKRELKNESRKENKI